ncbi:hypothetical protein [Actinoplanes sp. NPDC051851]|uniref:hypothetical protein n=1 Tax=Actinoplanes sp. NPDC051851 TaxID=3154753 RepID=UPI00342255E1
MNNDCTANRHGTDYAVRKLGCTCPTGLAARRASRGRIVPSATGRHGRPPAWLINERIATTAALTRQKYSAADIAVRLGVAQRTVIRYRALIRQPTIAR